MKHLFYITFILIGLISCKKPVKNDPKPIVVVKKPQVIKKFGFDVSKYKLIQDTIKKNETFGSILNNSHIGHKLIYDIVNATKSTFDVSRQLRVGKPYTIFAKKDSTEKAQIFVYQPNKIDYVVLDFRDSIQSYIGKKPIKKITRKVSGVIESSLSNAISDQGINYAVTYALSDIYAWTIDFYHLQKGDKFKVIYEELFIEDTLSVGIGHIKAAYFEHVKKPLYGFRFETDSVHHVSEYFDETAKNLRRTFLKAPLKFSNRISSRYNLKRRIKHYGNKIKPHKGTDFPSPIGTPIIATANGTVVKSAYKGGNGNYVKIKHNGTYSTQYLHMKKRKVKVGDFVKQGEVIGWIGMTGSTSGPHVCYRFWKNGEQVDPFRQKLPAAEPLKADLKPIFFNHIKSLKDDLDNIDFKKNEAEFVSNDSIK